ncbi:MAG: hypothetical protein KKB50_15655 [Planctomycetes bacterium]|nr:hypothetical protein [Planctomycetota bacterium]
MFGTLGIWWNNAGYPDEDGCQRIECAFEPIPGPTSSLAEAYPGKGHLSVPPQGRLAWEITWNITLT